MGFLSDKDINEVERILLGYLAPKLKRRELDEKSVENIRVSFLSGFQNQWEYFKSMHGFVPPPYGWGARIGEPSHFETFLPSGVLNNPENFGYCLGYIVGTLKYVPKFALEHPEFYQVGIQSLATSSENRVFYRYIQTKLRAWHTEIRKQIVLIRKYREGYKIMRGLIT